VETPQEEAHWVLRAQLGEREAIERLLASVQVPLRRYLARLAGAADADDLLQDVLLIVFRKLIWLDNPMVFRPWAFRIASRAAFRWLRRRRRWHERTADDGALDRIPAQEDRPPDDLLQRLDRLDGISPASQAVLILHFQEDLTLAEVAAILEIPLGTAKSRLAYGLRSLRTQLETNRRT
jgi:RNA polymerase sigma-70 factor (ECF subfamily)